MGKLRKSFQLRYMVNQPKLADIFAVNRIVSTLERNAMIPNVCMTIYGLVQLTIAVIGIQLELVGFHDG